MAEGRKSVEEHYEQAKRGSWELVLPVWQSDQRFAGGCSRYQNPFSGWTFLHQAARFGHEEACRQLIRLGASLGTLTYANETVQDVALKHHHHRLASLLRHAHLDPERDSSWSPPRDAALLPSSNRWEEAQERRASQLMRVVYCGSVITIPAGSRYFVDSFERTLIGFHGTYDPPSDMGCGSMV